MHKLVSIIIVNWNGLTWLRNCFGSLTKQAYKNIEIIFVDNASKDGSVQWVKNNYPITKIIINKENLGFAEANNVGYKAANGEYILFLNNDTKVSKSFLVELVNALENDPTIGGAQSKILLMDHPDTHDSVGAFLSLTGFLYHYGFGKKDSNKFNKQIDLYTAKGACMLFRNAVLEKVIINGNIFDSDYFAYFEETDLCHRIWLSGFRVVYAYKSVIYHKMGATSSGMNNIFIQYHSFKNRIRTYFKNFGTLWLWTIFPIHILLCELYAMVSFVRGNVELSRAVERAIWWNITNLNASLASRRIVQRNIRMIPDSQIRNRVMKYPKFTYFLHIFRGSLQNYEDT